MTRLDEIRARADAALPGPWRWFGNTATEMVFLGTAHSGRIFVLTPTIERVEGYMRTEDPFDFISERQYLQLSPEDSRLYTFHIDTIVHLMFHGDPGTKSHRQIARYEVLGGKTRAEAGLGPEADRSNSPLYREDLVGLDSAEAEFIAHAREDVDFLLAEVDRLQIELDHARGELVG